MAREVALPAPPLIKYDAACRAIIEAKTMDEVLEIRDKAEGLRAYAKIAKNKTMEIDAAEIRLRAERKLAEHLEAEKNAGHIAEPGSNRYRKNSRGVHNTPLENGEPITLREIGVDKNFAKTLRKLGSIPNQEFERQVKDWREDIEKSHSRVTTKLIKTRRSKQSIRESKAVKARMFDQRVKVFLDATKKYDEELQDADDSIEKFSPEAKKFTSRKIGKLITKLNEFKEKLDE